MNNFTINLGQSNSKLCILSFLNAKFNKNYVLFAAFLFLGLGLAIAQQPAANLDQLRNGSATSPNDPGQWVNGNLGSQNSHYSEGFSAAYRAVMTNMPASTVVSLTLEYDVKHSSRHALDYLTHYDRIEPHLLSYGHTKEEIDPTIGTSFTEGIGFATFGIPVPPVLNSPVASQPVDSYNDLPGGEKLMTIWNGTITNITYGPTADLSNSNEPQQIIVTFTTGSAGEVLLAWGGHIGSRHDWGSDGGGVPLSAGGISGSPYHMRLIDWNLNNLGNQDRSLSADAIAAPPECESSGAELVCADEDNIYSVITAGATNPTYTWEILNNTSGATFVNPPAPTDTNVTVNSGNSGGNYIVKVTVNADEGTVFCQVEVTVNKPTVTFTAPADLCKDAGVQSGLGGGSPQGGVYSGTGVTDDGNGMTYSFDPAAAGVGTHTITYSYSDGNGCDGSASDDVEVFDLPTIEVVDVVCGELSDFGFYSVDVTTNEGTVTSSHGTVTQNNEVSWTISNIPNGQNVIVTTTTSLGCEAKVEVQAPDCICIELDYEYTNVTCFGLNDATITVNGVSEGATVTINGQPYDANMLYTPGSYTIRAFYEGNSIPDCIIEEKIDITEPDLVHIDAVGTDVSCFGGNDGTITISNLSEGAVYTIKKNGLGADLSDQDYFRAGIYIVKAFLPQNEPSSEMNDGTNRTFDPCEYIVIVYVNQPEPLMCKLYTGFGESVDCTNSENNWISSSSVGQGELTYTWSLDAKGSDNGWGIAGDNTGATIEVIPGKGTAVYYLTVQDETGCISQCRIKVVSKCKIENQSSVSLYPNPVKDLLNVKFDKEIESDVTIEVYNLVGTKMFANTFSANKKKGASDMKIDFSRFPSHVYYVKIITDRGTIIKKVVLDK